MRRFLTTAALLVSLVLGGANAANASEPLRTGTIVGGYFPFAAVAPGPGPDCSSNVDCLPWLVAGCPKAMVGINPSLHSSIVDVGSLADANQPRTFVVRPVGQNDVDLIFGGVSVQFWSRTCHQLGKIGDYMTGITGRAEFAIPAGAAWMTVASVDSGPLRWRLW
jgi:hypothetical protein